MPPSRGLGQPGQRDGQLDTLSLDKGWAFKVFSICEYSHSIIKYSPNTLNDDNRVQTNAEAKVAGGGVRVRLPYHVSQRTLLMHLHHCRGFLLTAVIFCTPAKRTASAHGSLPLTPSLTGAYLQPRVFP